MKGRISKTLLTDRVLLCVYRETNSCSRSGGFIDYIVSAITLRGKIKVYYRMGKIIDVRFEGDHSLKEEEKLSYIRYINRNLSLLQEDIISGKGHVNVIFKKGFAGNITFVSDNEDLNKLVSSKLFNAPPFQY